MYHTNSQSIIIPFHKDKDMLQYCLKTLKRTLPFEVEIIVVGNNYDFNELDLTFEDSDIKYYKVKENLLYPKAVNFGVSKSSGEIITICDPDTFYWDDWYTPLLEKFLESDEIGAVSSKLINPLTNRIIDFGMSFTKLNAGHPTKGLLYDHPLAKIDREVQAACSAVLMTSRYIYDSVGGMDNDLPFAYTDCDYCLKLKENNLKTWVVANSKVYHKGSSDANNSKYYAFSSLRTESKGMFYAKNFNRFVEDLDQWFNYSLSFFNNRWPDFVKPYILLDFTTIYNREYYYEIFEKAGFHFLDSYVLTVPQRNINELSLYNYVAFRYIDYATPILYFVDEFASLFNNQLWFRMRNIDNDLVIDRHGNIFPLKEIATNNC